MDAEERLRRCPKPLSPPMSSPLAVQMRAVKAKRIAIVGEPSITGEKVKISKSQSALVNQYTTMEKKLKAQVTATTHHRRQSTLATTPWATTPHAMRRVGPCSICHPGGGRVVRTTARCSDAGAAHW